MSKKCCCDTYEEKTGVGIYRKKASTVFNLVSLLHKKIPFNDVVDMTIVESDAPGGFSVYMIPKKFTTLCYYFNTGVNEKGDNILLDLKTFKENEDPKSSLWSDHIDDIITLLEEVTKISDATIIKDDKKIDICDDSTSFYLGDIELPPPSIEEKIWDYLSKLRNMNANIIESKEATIVPQTYIPDALNLTIRYKELGGFSLQANITNNFFKSKIVNNFKASKDGKEEFKPLPLQYSERLKNIFLITLERAYNENIEKNDSEMVEKKLSELEAYLSIGS